MKRKTLSWSLVILWMILIFYLSHQPAAKSNGLSKEIAGKIIEIVNKICPDLSLNARKLNSITRKSAHFLAYMVLGFLVSKGIRSRGIYGAKNIVITLPICILYAVSDEFHQLFVLGRGGQVSDVILDSAGVIIGIVLHMVSVKKPVEYLFSICRR